MTESATPISDLIEKLLSHDLSRESLGQALTISRPIEAAMVRVATTASMSIVERRHKERVRKATYRAGLSRNVPRDAVDAIPSSPSPRTQRPNKKRKDHAVPPVPGTGGTKRGSALPDSWAPDDVDYEYGKRLGLAPQHVDAYAEDMRLWGRANSNRAVGRKADWRATFHGWMRREAPKLIRQHGGAQNAAAKGTGFSGIAARLRRSVESSDAEFSFGGEPPPGPKRRD